MFVLYQLSLMCSGLVCLALEENEAFGWSTEKTALMHPTELFCGSNFDIYPMSRRIPCLTFIVTYDRGNKNQKLEHFFSF